MSEKPGTYMGESQEDSTYQIRDEAPHDYYCQIPNLVDLMRLSPYAYRLYGHLRKVAGESGKCWQSTKTLADACQMSGGQVSKCKEELENTYPPLIRIESKPFDRGMYHEITICDIWTINHAFFAGEKVSLKLADGVAVHDMNHYRSLYELDRSLYETKNNPIKNNPLSAEKTKKQQTIPEGADPSWGILKGVSSEEIARLSEKERRERFTADLWEREMGYNPLPWWDDRKLGKLLAFLVEQTPNDIHTFANWTRRPFSTFDPIKARRFPDQVMDFWPQAFDRLFPEQEQQDEIPDLPTVGAPPPDRAAYEQTLARLKAQADANNNPSNPA